MRKVLIAILLAVPVASWADDGAFTPSPEQIAKFEAQLTGLPELTVNYARYYVGVVRPLTNVNGEMVNPKRIDALFLPLKPGEAPAARAVEGGELPPLLAEGCVAYMGLVPNVSRVALRCAHAGAWEPSDADIADLESHFVLPKGAMPLGQYARYYAGVGEEGVKLIRAVYIRNEHFMPLGIHKVGEMDLPVIFDGGCRVISLQYNPQTKLSSSRCRYFG